MDKKRNIKIDKGGMATDKKKHIKIVYSCLTGKPVWVYVGRSANPRMAYWRACKAEIERVRNWPKIVAERKAWIMKLLNACTANLPIMSEMPEEKRKAAKRLLAMAEEKVPCYMEFYNHIMETKRRREEDRKIRQQMREREKLKNNDYDK